MTYNPNFLTAQPKPTWAAQPQKEYSAVSNIRCDASGDYVTRVGYRSLGQWRADYFFGTKTTTGIPTKNLSRSTMRLLAVIPKSTRSISLTN